MNIQKTLVSALLITLGSTVSVASFASNADDIRYRLQKVGKLNISGAPAASAPESSTSVAAAEVSPADAYQSSCFACHGTGAAGAPKLGDAAAWGPRIAKGDATLLNNAINGINGMPPRGGSSLDDSTMKAVVAYMVENSQ